MSEPLTYEEILNYAGGSSCVNEGQFVLKVSELFAAESLGYITISADAKRQLKARFSP